MALDCISNYTGLAYHNLHGSFIMNFIFIAFLLLCIIPIRVQIVTICDRLNFYKHFNVVFGKLYRIFHTAYGKTVPSITCARASPEENHTKTAPTIDADLTTIG